MVFSDLAGFVFNEACLVARALRKFGSTSSIEQLLSIFYAIQRMKKKIKSVSASERITKSYSKTILCFSAIIKISRIYFRPTLIIQAIKLWGHCRRFE